MSISKLWIYGIKRERETWPRPCNSSNTGLAFVVVDPNTGDINDKLS